MASIELEAFYPQPIGEVWEALVTPEFLAQWLMRNEGFRPEPGVKFRFFSKPVMGWKGIAYCEVLKVEKPHLISWTQAGEEGQKDPFVITWTLKEERGGTLLSLSHQGLHGLRGFMIKKVMGAGWKKIMFRKLPALLAREKA
jgi:uncharacterized protein YndB with AHSA1/START domain